MNIIINTIFALLLILPQASFAALAATTVWEVEQNATAADVNGGGFNPSNASAGTDRSMSPTAFANGTDLVSTNATTNPCVITSASHNFVAADNGNIIFINSGTSWTADRYEVVSTSGNAATLDRACGSVASISGGTWHLGGALSWQNASATTWATKVVAGNTTYVKFSATKYTQTASMTITDSSAVLRGQIIGYNTTRGDNPTGANRPTIDLAGTSNTLSAYTDISNLIFTGTAVTPLASDGNNVWFNIKCTNTSTAAGHFCIGNGSDDLFDNIEVVSQAGFGISQNGDMTIQGSYIHDSATCIRFSGAATGAVNISDTILAGCMTNGIQISAAQTTMTYIKNNTIYGGNVTGTGISLATGATGIRLLNNIITAFATGVSATTANTRGWSNNNAFNGNTTDRTNWLTGASDFSASPGFANVAVVSGTAGVVSGSTLTDSGADFTNVTDGRDYLDIITGTGVTSTPGSILISSHTTHSVTVAAAIGGTGTNIVYYVRTGNNFAVGPNMKFKGFPGIFPASLTTGYLGVGAAQRHEYGRRIK